MLSFQLIVGYINIRHGTDVRGVCRLFRRCESLCSGESVLSSRGACGESGQCCCG